MKGTGLLEFFLLAYYIVVMHLKRVHGGDLFLIYSHLCSLKLKIKLHTNTKLLVFVFIMAYRGISRSIEMLFYMSNQRLDVPAVFNEHKSFQQGSSLVL